MPLKSLWPFSTGLGREAKQQSVRLCVKAVKVEGGVREGGTKEISKIGKLLVDWAQPWEEEEGGGYRERVKEGPGEQEDTHYSTICAAEKHKYVLRKVCVAHTRMTYASGRLIGTWACSLHEWWKVVSPQCYINHTRHDKAHSLPGKMI